MTDITRRNALCLLGAVAVPSAATTGLAAAHAPKAPMTIDEFLAVATPAERVRYHSNALMDAMSEMHPDQGVYRSQIDHELGFAFITPCIPRAKK